MMLTGGIMRLLTGRQVFQMNKKRFFRVLAYISVSVLAFPAAFSHDAEPIKSHNFKHEKHSKPHTPEVKHSLLVNASAENVWQAIQHQRKSDHHRRLISYDGKAATLHETFAALPIVGEASCEYVENESAPLARIDYSMVKSDRFQVFEGSWILSPGKNEHETKVELSNAIDPGIRVPFWQDITRLAASRMVKRRLDAVSTYAENLQKDDK